VVLGGGSFLVSETPGIMDNWWNYWGVEFQGTSRSSLGLNFMELHIYIPGISPTLETMPPRLLHLPSDHLVDASGEGTPP